MDNDAVLAMFDRQMRQDARADAPGAEVERDGDVVRQVGAAHDWNGVLWSDLDRDTADAAIAAQVRHFTSVERECEWKLYTHDRPDDLGARLRAAGFTAEPAEALMVAQVRDLPTEVELPEGVQLRPVTEPADLDLVVEAHEQAFGTDGSRLEQQLRAQLAAAPDTLVAVVAMAGDLPVCAARMELHPGTEFASLWGGGTAAPWRGKGIYKALVAHRTNIAAERGFRYLQVDASDQSRPILQRLGFVHLSTTTPYVYQP
ncbi:GNAT family N-acetyltransferase [Streptomyces sp. H27-D2]|uniref:GNAT family N-acetyltransferase n=1 Tax=Streptomyces sp. H27-D2 TaxID=3046304 RepID=UPI002DBD0F58|nr:GNAT family N-acetyltransferase [Streptomyces sp. H27-D2]MEC4018591.1 GNAT family N-acetyltransferase [Streptomyces sp. H27-D2]